MTSRVVHYRALWRHGIPATAPGTPVTSRIATFLTLGYLSLTRSFAYWGLPPIFVGEIGILALLTMRARTIFRLSVGSFLRRTELSGFAWLLYGSLAFGSWQLIRGLGAGYPPIRVLQTYAFTFYQLCIVIGIALALYDYDLLRRTALALARWNGIYGAAYVVLLSHLSWRLPWAPTIPVFGQPAGSAISLFALLCFEKDFRKALPFACLNGFVLLAVQVRAEWLGFVVALTVWSILSGRILTFVRCLAVILVILGVGFWADVTLPSPPGRGQALSVREVVARAAAPVNTEFARRYSTHADTYAGTVEWRTKWWRAIWQSSHADLQRALVGQGYGFPLYSLVPYLASFTELRTPHNAFFYMLGYGGWIGVIVFYLLQAKILHLLIESYRKSSNPFGVQVWILGMVVSLFSNFFETPFGSIPFYLLIGIAIGDLLREATPGFSFPE